MKILTWNAQGSKLKKINLIRALKSDGFDVDIILIQEATEPLSEEIRFDEDNKQYEAYKIDIVRADGTTVTWIQYFRHWTFTDQGNKRCSLLTLTKAVAADVMVIPPKGKRRPSIGVKLDQFSPWVFNCHATSGGGGGGDVAYLAAMAEDMVGGANQQWVIAGDFNCEPNDLRNCLKKENFDRAQKFQWKIIPPEANTHPVNPPSTNKYDYAVISSNLTTDSKYCNEFTYKQLQSSRRMTTSTETLKSDHVPQFFKVNAPVLHSLIQTESSSNEMDVST